MFQVTTIFSDDLLRKLYNREIWRKMKAKSSFFTQEMHCKGVHAWPILGPSLTLINIMPLYERPQSHGKSCGTISTSFKHPFLNDPRGVAGPTSLYSTIVLDSCSSFVVFAAQRNAQLRTTTNFSSLSHRIVRSWSSRMVALNVCSRSFPDQKWIRAGSGLAGRRWACL